MNTYIILLIFIILTEILNTEDEIYKGKLYEEKQREITENVKINVNCLKVMANIELQEESNENLETKQISINKNNMLEILGKDGIIEILDVNTENKISEINKDAETDENGNIEIKTNDVEAIKINTSEPQKVGALDIKVTKIIKEEQENKIILAIITFVPLLIIVIGIIVWANRRRKK